MIQRHTYLNNIHPFIGKPVIKVISGIRRCGKSISDFLKSQHLKLSVDTIQNYIGYCVDAILVDKVQRYDIKGKRMLETFEKYFFNDVGIKNAITRFLPEYLPGLLENLVMLEMKFRGYQLHIGKERDKEVDFIAS